MHFTFHCQYGNEQSNQYKVLCSHTLRYLFSHRVFWRVTVSYSQQLINAFVVFWFLSVSTEPRFLLLVINVARIAFLFGPIIP